MSFIELDGVTKSYDDVLVLDDINATIKYGEFVTIIGPYGSGKSTLLRVLAGLLGVDSGQVMINGVLPSQVLERRKIGYAFQNANVLPWKTVRGNVDMVQNIAGISDDARLKELLQLGDLWEYADRGVHQLSGGMKQVLGIVRALALDPDLLILDEPFASIDEVSRDRFHKILQKIHKETRKTTIMVTHSLHEAVLLSDRVIVLTKKPARIKGIVTIPKRSKNDIYGEAFGGQVKKLRVMLADD